MPAMSTYLSNKLLDHVFQRGNANYTPPSELYVALYTVAPDENGGGVEVSGEGYERIQVSFSMADEGEAKNSVDVVWPVAEEDWGTIVAFGILDAATNGNLLFFGNLTQARTVAAGEAPKILKDSIVITIDPTVMSYYLANALLDHVLQKGNANFTPPSNLYVALYTVSPDATGGGTEVDGESYARQEATFAPAADMETSNDAEIAWPTAEEEWGTFPAIGILDAPTNGNLLMFGNLNDPRTITEGESFRIPEENLVIILR